MFRKIAWYVSTVYNTKKTYRRYKKMRNSR